jgi:hypothetical protein
MIFEAVVGLGGRQSQDDVLEFLPKDRAALLPRRLRGIYVLYKQRLNGSASTVGVSDQRPLGFDPPRALYGSPARARVRTARDGPESADASPRPGALLGTPQDTEPS